MFCSHCKIVMLFVKWFFNIGRNLNTEKKENMIMFTSIYMKIVKVLLLNN